MISAFVGGLIEMAKRPLLIVPALLGIAINVIVLLLCLDSFQNIFIGAVLLNELPNAPPLDALFYFAANNAADIAIISIALYISLLIGALTIFAYTKALQAKKGGIAQGISFALSNLPNALGLGAFAFIAVLLYAAVALTLLLAGVSEGATGIIALALFLLWLAFGAYSYTKFVFTPLFMALDGTNLKKALAQSWVWSSGKFIPLLIFLFLAYFASSVISGAAVAASDAISAEEISFAVLLFGVCLSNAYYNIVFVKFFTGQRQ